MSDNNSDCGCTLGYAQVETYNTNTYTTPTAPTNPVKVTAPSIRLKVSDYDGYALVTQEATVESANCNTSKCNTVLQKVEDWMKSAVCATKLRFLGIDEDGTLSKFCESGYIHIDDEGYAEVVEELPINAECLWHEDVTLSGGEVLFGDPLCVPHIAVTDATGKLYSQKPKQGQQSILVGDGDTGLWCQKSIDEAIPKEITEYSGTFDSFKNGVCGNTLTPGMYFFTGDCDNGGHYSVVECGGNLEIRKLDYTVIT